jgi:hypothetical protein
MDRGAVTVRSDGTFAVDGQKAREAVIGLTHDIMTMQAEGNYAAAKDLRDRLGVVRPAVQKALDSLLAVPTDIEPRFTTADQIVAEANRRE